MNAGEFKKLVNRTFAENIRQLGWKGSGFHFYKADPNHVVNIFGLQGSWTGGGVCCETALHFDFIPDLAHRDMDVSKTTCESCIIRQRLSPKGYGDYRWIFRDREEDNLESINQIWDSFRVHGLRFYTDFEHFPTPFDSIKPSDLDEDKNYRLLGKYPVMNQIEFVWLLKEINLFIDRNPMAKEFAALGLKMASAHADAMARQFKGKKALDDIQTYRDLYKNKFQISG
jgi:hypothetical protein